VLAYDPLHASRFFFALTLIFAALGTDFLDGYLARKYGIASESGYIIDGLADRAFYIALILAMVGAHSLSLIAAWLLIIREIAMYALRLLQPVHWFEKHRSLRKITLWHAGSIRIWFLSYFLADFLALLTPLRLYEYNAYRLLQLSLLLLTLCAGYLSVVRLASRFLHHSDGLSRATPTSGQRPTPPAPYE
jgi:phosphatidylglycerophosphate synthase